MPLGVSREQGVRRVVVSDDRVPYRLEVDESRDDAQEIPASDHRRIQEEHRALGMSRE